jgi:uncharacterized protein YjdB
VENHFLAYQRFSGYSQIPVRHPSQSKRFRNWRLPCIFDGKSEKAVVQEKHLRKVWIFLGRVISQTQQNAFSSGSTSIWNARQSSMAKFLRCFSLIFLGVMTACGGGGISNSNSTGSPASIVLQAIQVVANNPSFPAGVTQQFTATGSYSDGTTKDLTLSATWSSSNSTVATVASNGVAKAISPGSCSIIATQANIANQANVSGKATLTVAPPALTSIAISSAASSVATGLTDQFTATGNYSDGSTQNLSSSATWSISNSAIASISTSGLATAKSNGSAIVTATQGSISGTGTMTVGAAVLASIAVSSASGSIPAGFTDQFTAIGTYSDGTNQNVSAAVTWSVSSSSIATISAGGLASAKAQGSATVTATQGSITGSTALTVQPPVLASIAVTSASPSVAAGVADQFTAIGAYSDGSTQNLTSTVKWTVSSSSIATISNAGLATSKAQGSTIITATQGSISGTALLIVGTQVLASIAVSSVSPSIASGLTDQFTAIGTYSDGSTQNLSNSVTWSVSNPAVASITNSGLTTGKSSGSAVITATQGSINGTSALTVSSPLLVSVTVTSASSSIGVGLTDQFTATGTYSDGSSQNISGAVTWSASNPALVTISNSGLVNAKSNGSVIVTAASGSISGTAPLTVTISLVSIAVTPPLPTIAPGTAQQFKAMGTFTDGSTQDLTGTVNWNSSDITKATIGASGPAGGLAHALAAGSTTITASSGTVSASATLTVNAAKLQTIAVTPANSIIPVGVVQQFTAIGTFDIGPTQDITNTVTWSSSQPTLASITVSGAATARNTGTTTITASSGSITGSTSLTVNLSNLVSVSIQPGTLTIAQGTTAKLNAIGLFNDGSTRDVSAQATWSSSNPSFATAQSNGNGKVHGVSLGLASITATLPLPGAQTASVNVNVTNATIVSISVTPSISSIAPGTQITFAATGQFSDSTTQVISGDVNWASSDPTIATISTNPGTKGIAASVATGSVAIGATFGAVTGTAQLNVSGANLTGITVNPPSAVLAPASTQQYVATATYDDLTTQNVSTLVTWSSSSTSVATVTAFGQATGQSAGSATITASMGGFTASSTLLVESNGALNSIAVSPSPSTVPQQIMTGFTAIGLFADGSTQDLTSAVTWTSSNASFATVSNVAGTRGLATGIAPGASTISAVFAGQVGTAALTVTNFTLVSLGISPGNLNINLGSTQSFVATGIFSDGSTMNLSSQAAWSSSNVNFAVINSQGVATSVSSGTTTITATLNGVSATAILTVN